MEKKYYKLRGYACLSVCKDINNKEGFIEYVGSTSCTSCKHYLGEGKNRLGVYVKCSFNKNTF